MRFYLCRCKYLGTAATGTPCADAWKEAGPPPPRAASVVPAAAAACVLLREEVAVLCLRSKCEINLFAHEHKASLTA